jgi:hypothetical protein
MFLVYQAIENPGGRRLAVKFPISHIFFSVLDNFERVSCSFQTVSLRFPFEILHQIKIVVGVHSKLFLIYPFLLV